MSKILELDLEKACDQAQKNNEVEALIENFFSLALLYQKNFEIRSLLNHKQLTIEEKLSILKEVPGFKTSQVFEDVLEAIIENNHTKSIQNIYEKISVLLSEKQNQIVLHVETAVPLTQEFTQTLSAQFATIFKKQIILKAFVNPELIAGIVVKLPGGQEFDYSYERLLSDFKHYLRERN